MATARTQDELCEHLHLAVECLEINIDAYWKGRRGGWLAVVGQLYVLLCDNHLGPLVEQVIPNFTLHELTNDLSQEPDNQLLYIPVIQIPAPLGGPQLFDPSRPGMALDEWLDQTVIILSGRDSGVPLTIRTLISAARNKLGPGHYVPVLRKWKEEERRAKAALENTLLEGGQQRPIVEKYLIVIAEHVVSQIHQQHESKYGVLLHD